MSSPLNDPKLEALLELNEEYQGRLAVLHALHRSYQGIPKAHRELAQALENPSMSLEWIQSVHDEGRRLERLYKELREENEGGDE